MKNKSVFEDEKCRKCGGKKVVFIEYSWDSPEHYDGVSEIQCKECGTRFGRWSDKELAPGEAEKRYGKVDDNKKKKK